MLDNKDPFDEGVFVVVLVFFDKIAIIETSETDLQGQIMATDKKLSLRGVKFGKVSFQWEQCKKPYSMSHTGTAPEKRRFIHADYENDPVKDDTRLFASVTEARNWAREEQSKKGTFFRIIKIGTGRRRNPYYDPEYKKEAIPTDTFQSPIWNPTASMLKNPRSSYIERKWRDNNKDKSISDIRILLETQPWNEYVITRAGACFVEKLIADNDALTLFGYGVTYHKHGYKVVKLR